MSPCVLSEVLHSYVSGFCWLCTILFLQLFIVALNNICCVNFYWLILLKA